MKKLLTKIATTVVGFAMAIGVGVAVTNNIREMKPAYAATRVYTATGSGATATLTNSDTSTSWTIGTNKPMANETSGNARGLQWSKSSAELSLTPAFDVTGLTLRGSSNAAGQTISYKIGTADPVTVANMTATNNTDYTFTNFSSSSGTKITINITAGSKSTYVKSITLSYVEGTTWKVSFDMQGHGTQVSSQTIADNGKVTKPADPSATGYTFGGWFKESGCTNAWNFSTDTVTAATTLYAKWTAKTSALTFNMNGGTGTAPTGLIATYDAAMPTYGQSAPTKVGHTFAGFYDGSGGTGTQYYTNTLVSARNWDKNTTDGTTLYAKWTVNSYTVTFNVQGHGTAPSSQSINYGAKVSKPSDPTATGYKFKGWYRESACVNEWNFSEDTISEATTLFAKWVVTYVVTFDMQGHGTAPSDQIIETGGTVTQPAAPTAAGYAFGGWFKESGCINAWNFSTDTVTAATTLYAKWTTKTSALTFNMNGGTGTAPTGLIATYGAAMPTYGEDAPTKEGYNFAGFYDNSSGTGSPYYNSSLESAKNWDKDTTSATTLYAKWIAKVFTVSFDVQGHGTAPSSQEVSYDAKVTKPSDPSESGYKFKGWYKESSCTNAWDFGNDVVHGATTLYAKWEVKVPLGGLTSDGRYFLIVGGHVLKASTFANKGADPYTTSNSSIDGLTMSDAWYFASTGTDDQWTIRVSDAVNASYLYSTSDNNGLVSGSTSDSWTVLEGSGTYEGKLVIQDSLRSRYLSYTSNTGSHIRTYLNTGTGDCEVSFIPYVEPKITISGKTSEFTDTYVTLSSTAGASTNWEITVDESSVGSLSTTSGATTNLSVSGEGTVTVTASAEGYESASHTVVFTARPSYYMSLSSECDDGTASLGIFGKSFMITVDESNLAGNIEWQVTSGTVSDITSDNDGFLATFASIGTVTIKATDLGHTENTQSISFTVIEGLNAINAYTDYKSSLVFTSECGGSGTSDDGMSWTIVGSTGTSSVPESTYDPTKGIHYGTGGKTPTYVKSITLTSGSSYSNITKITVNASKASGVASATVSVKVGNTTYGGDPKSIGNDATEYTFTDVKSSGAVEVLITKPSNSENALYCKSIVVETVSDTTSNIANTNATVQLEVLNFVSIMNTDLSVCSGSSVLDTTVWSTLAAKFEGAAAASADEDLFRQMFKYADATPRAGDGSATTGDSLQNALARYNYVLEKYGTASYEDFLHRAEASKVTPKSALSGNIFGFVINNSNMAPIIVIISMISIAAVGGYYFLRKRKED